MVKDYSFLKILVYLNRDRKTGTLTVKTPRFKKKIYLDRGNALFASSTDENDRLGEMLIKAGKITMEQYDRSVEVMKEEAKRLGTILVELGYLTLSDLMWAVKHQVKEIILSLFQLEDVEWEFKEGEIPPNEVITLKISMANLIYEGLKKIDNLARMKREMLNMDSVLKLSTDPVNLFQDIVLSPRDKKILSMVDGNKTIKELIYSSSATSSFETIKTLFILYSIGMVEEKEKVKEEVENVVSLEDILHPAPEEKTFLIQKVNELYSQLNRLSPSELLDIDEGSDAKTIEKNYYKLVKEYHPDKYITSTDLSIYDKAIAIFEGVKKAYSLLKDESKRIDYFNKQRLIALLHNFLNAIKRRQVEFFGNL